jgi:hypothetical protein
MRKLGEAKFPHLENLTIRGEALEDGILALCREPTHISKKIPL